jgi:hypothetical protein
MIAPTPDYRHEVERREGATLPEAEPDDRGDK